MQRSIKLASQISRTITGEPSLTRWGFAVHTAMALVAIVLLTLTFAALEISLSDDQTLSALEATVD